VNSRLWDQQKRRSDNRRCCSGHVEQSVDGGSQVPATGNVGHWNAVVDEVRRCFILETRVDGYGKLVLHSLRDVKQFAV